VRIMAPNLGSIRQSVIRMAHRRSTYHCVMLSAAGVIWPGPLTRKERASSGAKRQGMMPPKFAPISKRRA